MICVAILSTIKGGSSKKILINKVVSFKDPDSILRVAFYNLIKCHGNYLSFTENDSTKIVTAVDVDANGLINEPIELAFSIISLLKRGRLL